jgi:predicted nucleic acid-binding protein
MAWVVDTCVLLDVLEDDPAFAAPSAALLERLLDEGLEVCPVTFAELAPAFEGDRGLQEEFLAGVGISLPPAWRWDDTLAAHQGWARHVHRKRRGVVPRRPLADILIGAHATRRSGLVTRNPGDFRPVFPDLRLAIPER